MKTHVDFEFTKAFAGYKKGDVKSFYRPMARDLQDNRKVGKILGPTLTKADHEMIDEHKQLIEKEVERQVGDLKAENKTLKAENTKLKKAHPNKEEKPSSNKAQ